MLYCFRGNGLSKLDVSSTASSSSHLIALATTDTAALVSGNYSVAGYAINNSITPAQRIQVYLGTITVTANLQTMGAGVDFRSQNRRTLDNINAVIEGRASATILKSTVEGTTLERIPFADLLHLQAIYRIRVRNEEIDLLQLQGKPTGRTSFVNFTKPK